MQPSCMQTTTRGHPKRPPCLSKGRCHQSVLWQRFCIIIVSVDKEDLPLTSRSIAASHDPFLCSQSPTDSQVPGFGVISARQNVFVLKSTRKQHCTNLMELYVRTYCCDEMSVLQQTLLCSFVIQYMYSHAYCAVLNHVFLPLPSWKS